MLFSFLESFVGPVIKFAVRSAGNLAGGGIIPVGEFLVEGWDYWAKRTNEQQRKAEFEKMLREQREFRRQTLLMIERRFAHEPAEARRFAANYFARVPSSLQRSFRRSDDPSGRTVPTDLPLRKADDLRKLLPDCKLRFQPGDRPLPGSDLVLEEWLGEGGMGEVWKARHANREHAQPVALKFCTNPEYARSLRKEVDLLDRVAKQGRHDGIVELRYVHLEADPPCLEYECVEDGDLGVLIAELHKANQATPERVARIIMRVAQIVGFAHRQGIVHRDLKPANILIRRENGKRVQFKVNDFGIGGIVSQQEIKEWSRETGGSSAGSTLSRGTCTPLYASPQQRRLGEPDPRDDVYALGVIWFQMMMGDVTKEPPRGGGWKKRLADQGMPLALIALLEKCIEDDAQDRPADAAVLAKELEQVLAGSAPISKASSAALRSAVPVRPVPHPSPDPPSKPGSSRAIIAVGAAGLGVLLLIGCLGIGFALFRGKTSDGQPPLGGRNQPGDKLPRFSGGQGGLPRIVAVEFSPRQITLQKGQSATIRVQRLRFSRSDEVITLKLEVPSKIKVPTEVVLEKGQEGADIQVTAGDESGVFTIRAVPLDGNGGPFPAECRVTVGGAVGLPGVRGGLPTLPK